ncbi:MAG: hypothetical protein KC416_07485 [Myxococcales bacterium]|nr:hypothetical protein [Myxococcales bacterium]
MEFLLVLAIGGFVFAAPFILRSLFILEPGEATLLLYWGKFRRTVSTPGFHIAFPLGLRRVNVNIRDYIVNLPLTSVVEAHGNPIQVSAVVIYRIVDPRKAALDMQNVHRFVLNQASTTLKTVCSRFPYESEHDEEHSLKGESQGVVDVLRSELQSQVMSAGVKIGLVRLNDLTYAPEIMQAMLLRQQAEAMVDARRTVVEGAVMTVREALDQLERSGAKLSPASEHALVSNLTLLLCAGDRGESHSTVISARRGD